MREALAEYNNTYIEVEAKFGHYAWTCGHCNLMFENITLNGELISDHIWIQLREVKKKGYVDPKSYVKGGIYKIRAKVYVYRKLSKVTGEKTVEDFGFKRAKITPWEVVE